MCETIDRVNPLEQEPTRQQVENLSAILVPRMTKFLEEVAKFYRGITIKIAIKTETLFPVACYMLSKQDRGTPFLHNKKYKNNISIFITGSNSDLLSGELATHIAGRYVSFKILPFSFKEVCVLKECNSKSKYELEQDFEDYMWWGGMPQRFIFDSEEQIRTYLTDVYNSIVVKDIVERFKVKDIDLFNRIVEYILSTPAQTFSAESLVRYFESENRGVTKNTLYNYLEYMSKALLINKVDRYDVRGKRILNGKYKYYLTDLGLGRIMNISKKEQIGAYIENIVYNELIYRGYDVKIGSLDNGEIDFIALKDGKKEYYQVCYILSDERTIEREFNAYNSIDDNYPKYVISMDKLDQSRNGIIHKNIIEWLLED